MSLEAECATCAQAARLGRPALEPKRRLPDWVLEVIVAVLRVLADAVGRGRALR